MRKVGLSLFGFLVLAAVVGFFATGGLSGSTDVSSGGGAGQVPVANGAPERAVGGAVAGTEGSVPAAGANETVAADESAASGASTLGSVGGLPPIGAAVVKTGTLEVQVAKGTFGDAFRRALDVAARYGGYVQSSSTSGTRVHAGSITLRVPSSSFERAMSDLSGLGTPQSRSMSGQDVTNEFVDLNARLRTWQAQEAVLLRLMRSASSVEATLRVQANLQDVQFRIEQIKGQLRVLQNQTDLATIDVSIHEPGAIVHPRRRPRPNERPSLAEAWTKAVDGFLGVIYATVVGLGYLVPISLICAALWLAVRRVRPAASS